MQTAPDTSIIRDLVFLVIGAVIGAGLGFIGTYLVQRSGQNRAWKREYILKNVEEIFVPLYKEIHSIIIKIENFEELPYTIFSNSEWNAIRKDYRTILVEDGLRERLNILYESEYRVYKNKLWDAIKKIVEIWFECIVKEHVEAKGHQFANAPTVERDNQKFSINIQEVKNKLTELVRNYISSYIFLSEIKSESYVRQELRRYKYDVTSEEFPEELQLLRDELETQEEIQGLKLFSTGLLIEMKGIKELLKERIKRPYEAKL